MLQLGSTGVEVKLFQEGLKALNLLADIPDGVFGKNTDKATKQFQTAQGLVSDGKVGPATLTAMNAANPGWTNKLAEDVDNEGPSNLLVVNGKYIRVPDELGVTLTNYVHDDEVHFEHRARTRKLEHACIHESVTNGKSATVSVLRGKGLGVHLIIASDGKVSQHCDLVREQVPHANQLNGSSIGIEVINPYSPKYANKTYQRTIPGTWWTWSPKGAKDEYTLPTPAQEETIKKFIPWLLKTVGIPCVAPTMNNTAKIDGWEDKKKPQPGVVAHYDFSSHADGRYPLELLKGLLEG